MYLIIKKLLFLFDPEWVHYFSMNAFRALTSVPFLRRWLMRQFTPKNADNKQLFGLRFRNPVGLGAGFDKNARYLRELDIMGFGFIEIGTVTPLPQHGNEKPRLFRLKRDEALINRMGFNNDGVKAVADRLRKWKMHEKEYPTMQRVIIGGNIGKNKSTPNELAWKDYEICFKELADCVDYFVVNVSSPNTPGLRALQEKESLRKILSHLQTINRLEKHPRPLLLKIAPDLTNSQLDDVISLAEEIKLDGLVATNTTISREDLKISAEELESIGAGGLSGKPLAERSTEVLAYIVQHSKRTLPIIASGGIFSKADADRKFAAGASLLQVWTGFIYEGPSIVKKVLKGNA